jgi:hypothetical protein
MKLLAALIRASLLAALTIGILALATPVSASADTGAAKPSPKTAPRGGSEGPGNLSGTGPRETIIELTLLGGGLLVVGGALTVAARKPRIARP